MRNKDYGFGEYLPRLFKIRQEAASSRFSRACLKIRSRNEEAINSTRNETDLLTKCFLLPTFIDVDTFYLFLN